jgi:Lipocalin-like domain
MKIVRAIAVAVAMAMAGAMGMTASGFFAGSGAGKPPRPASSLRDQMIGTWKLESRVTKKPDGSIAPLPGWDGAPGYITYDPVGFMSVQFMQLHRTKESGATGYTAYFGTYTVDESTKTVTHHIIGDVNPDGVGADQPREVVLEGDALSLYIRSANSRNVNINSFRRMK